MLLSSAHSTLYSPSSLVPGTPPSSPFICFPEHYKGDLGEHSLPRVPAVKSEPESEMRGVKLSPRSRGRGHEAPLSPLYRNILFRWREASPSPNLAGALPQRKAGELKCYDYQHTFKIHLTSSTKHCLGGFYSLPALSLCVSVGDLVTKKRSPWLQCPLWTLEGAPGPQLTPVLGACFQCDKMLSTVSNKEKALFARSTGCGA